LHWHRYIGLAAATITSLLALTGIFVQHTAKLGLERHPGYDFGAVPSTARDGIEAFVTPHTDRVARAWCQPP
jgi:hypothetical protein